MIGGVLYSPNGIGLVEAFHPGHRKNDLGPAASRRPAKGCAATARAASPYWSDGGDERLFVQRGEYLIALDPQTGQPDPDVRRRRRRQPPARARTSDDLLVDRRAAGLPRRRDRRRRSMTDSPQSKEQPPGNVQAFDVRTGKLRWTFHVIPRAGRVRQRDLGERLVGVHRARESLVADQRRRGAGATRTFR